MAVFEDFQQIAALRWSEDGKAPVIEDKHIQFGDGPEHAGVTSVTSGQSEGLEEARDAVIDNAAPVTAGFVTKGAGDPAFAEACFAGPSRRCRHRLSGNGSAGSHADRSIQDRSVAP